MTLTNYSKRQIALAMVGRGEHFVVAAVLLERNGGNGYVWRHLLCQGAELIMKGSLLLHDYNKYKSEIKGFGHRLLVLAVECTKAFNLSPVTADLRKQLADVSHLYEKHALRYASGMDIFVDPDTIDIDVVVIRLYAASKLIRRHNPPKVV